MAWVYERTKDEERLRQRIDSARLREDYEPIRHECVRLGHGAEMDRYVHWVRTVACCLMVRAHQEERRAAVARGIGRSNPAGN